jgi:hypothetical protein
MDDLAWLEEPPGAARLSAQKEKAPAGFGGASSMHGAEAHGNPALATTLAFSRPRLKPVCGNSFFRIALLLLGDTQTVRKRL